MPYKFYILDGTGTTRHKHTFSSTATEKPNAGQHLNFPWLAYKVWPLGLKANSGATLICWNYEFRSKILILYRQTYLSRHNFGEGRQKEVFKGVHVATAYYKTKTFPGFVFHPEIALPYNVIFWKFFSRNIPRISVESLNLHYIFMISENINVILTLLT